MMSIKQEPDTLREELTTELEPDYSGRDMEIANEVSSPQVKTECDFHDEDSALLDTTLLQGQGCESTDPIGRDQVRILNDSGCHGSYFDNIKSEVNTPFDNSIDNNIHVSENAKDLHEYLPASDDLLSNQQDQVKVYKCGTCLYSSNRLFDLYQHNISHHTMENFHFCDLCQSPYQYLQDLKFHLNAHAGIKRHYSFKNKHKSKTQYLCDLCGYRCLMDKAISRHITRHLSGKRYSCDLCEYTCDFPYYMKQHRRKHTGEKPYSCNLCDYTCAHHSSLAQHLRKIHTGEKSYSGDCTVSGNKRRNVGRKVIQVPRTPYSCEFCGYTTEKLYDIKRHMRKHTGEKPYCCSLCDYTCALQCDFIQHWRTHTGEKPHSCDVCDYRCITSSHLKRHKRIHTGEKPYSCDLCDYTCSQSHYLKVHKRIHTGEKPYSCDFCDYTCTKTSYLKRHKQIHTDVKPFL